MAFSETLIVMIGIMAVSLTAALFIRYSRVE